MKVEKSLPLSPHLSEKDFSGKDLRGVSFRGKDLTGANFSRADIRGADFSRATLVNANFTKSRAGLTPLRVIGLVFALIALSGALGAVVGLVNLIVEAAYHEGTFVSTIPKPLVGIAIVSFALVGLQNGVIASFSVFIVAFVMAAIMAFISSAMIPLAGSIAVAMMVASCVSGATVAVVTLAVATAYASSALLGLLSIVVFGLLFIAISVASSGESAVAIASMVMFLSAYLSWKALRGDPRHTTIRLVAMAMVVRWGTRFYGANLTNANFTQALLRNTDFREALLTRSHWSNRVGADIPALIS